MEQNEKKNTNLGIWMWGFQKAAAKVVLLQHPQWEQGKEQRKKRKWDHNHHEQNQRVMKMDGGDDFDADAAASWSSCC